MTVIGTRLFGGTDEVPGLCHVATKFFHINFLPLCPLTSYLVLKQNFGHRSFQGVEIPLDGKSVALGYVRALATAAALFTGIWFIATANDPTATNDKWISLVYFLLTFLLACLLMWHKATRRASRERATELATLLGSKLGPRFGRLAQRHVNQHYQRNAHMSVPTTIDEEEEGCDQDEEDDDTKNSHTGEWNSESDELELSPGTSDKHPAIARAADDNETKAMSNIV